MLEQIVEQWGNMLLGAIFTFVATELKKYIKKEKDENIAMQAIMQDRLFQAMEYYTGKKSIPLEAKANLQNMHDAYTHLKFNHRGEEYWKKIDDLPVE